jgi:predicted small metal-binding protein
MTTMTCAQMGGPADCTATISGNTSQEIIENGTKHVLGSHPEMAEDMKKMTDEEKAKWAADFQPKFDAASEA